MILILGRFQPLHKGHLKVIEDAYKEDKDIVIAIGSAQVTDRKENPFSAEERKLMLEKTLEANNIKAKIILVPDIACDDTYVGHVEEFVGDKPDKIITENEWTIDLFKKAGYDVHITPRYFDISATDIRDKISKDEPWEDLVPTETLKVLKEINCVDRIKKISQDTP
ncbi:nicotinamide-nucleotide adenylyltransferase [Candidatus Woesearchaeota archaeon]|nr:nicotinamide-nucleotide adenylyltransferase [Candidatus Woesearchaeota archaeon]